jgi:TM2 domain-containing membrane protein YozV
MTSGPGETSSNSKRIVCGVCGILLGSLGVHKFILGLQTPAIIMLAVTLSGWGLSCFTFGLSGFASAAMWAIGIAEGIIYLTKTDAEFHQIYEVEKKEWF